MKIAIFGGSFDPVHIAHEAIAYKVLDEVEIDKLIIVPTYLNPFKKTFNYEPNIRADFLRKTFSNNKKIEICDYEIKQNRAVYSIETLMYLKKLYNTSKIYIIIGEDNVKSLNKWANIEELKKEAQFLVIRRASYKEDLNGFKTIDLNIDISSSSLRNKMDLNFIPKAIHKDIKIQKGKD